MGNRVWSEELSFLLAQVPGDFFVKDREGVYLACSDGLAQKGGFRCGADIVGLTDHDCIWKLYAPAYLKHDNQVMDRGESESFHESALFADGQIRLMKITKSPLRDRQGHIIGVMGLVMHETHVDDAYAQIFAELQEKQALHAAELQYLMDWYYYLSGEQCSPTLTCQQMGKKIRHYLEFMINQVPMNVFWMDTKGTVLGYNMPHNTIWNNEVVAQHAAGRYPYVGSPLADLLPPDIAAEVLSNNAAVLAGDKTLIFEERVRNAEGGENVYLSYKTPIFDDEHQKIGLMGVSVDITERKRMEEDLCLAKEKAEAAHMAKIQFLKNMRHDVRTPLSCITGSVKILKKMEDNPEKLEFMDGVLYSSENLLKMLTKMLEYDHIQSNERPLQYQSFKIRVLLRDLVEMFSFTTRQKGLALHCEISDNVPEDLVTDFYRFQRVILNLVNNAIKFTHEGHIRIALTSPDQHTLRCDIRDTGIGIEESKQDTVFQKYVRLVGSDQGQYQGEGLGLSIVKQFVEELGGQIKLESKLGEGTTFTVLLNLKTLPMQEV